MRFERYVVVYDIADTKRRNRVSQLLKTYGERVNLSVFECELKKGTLPLLRGKISGIIKRKEDVIIYYPLCLDCLARIISDGKKSSGNTTSAFCPYKPPIQKRRNAVPSNPAGHVWLTFVGRSLYESLNPYWSYCETGGKPPERIVILHPVRMTKEKERAIEAFSIISREYFKKDCCGIEGVSFDQSDISSFAERADAVFMDAASKSWKLIVDISPTAWSFAPVYFLKSVMAHKKNVVAMIYFQYMNDAHRNRPYPLIPRSGISTYDLLPEIAGK